MSEQTKVLMYSRDFLLSFSDRKRFDTSIHSVFKNSVETRSNEKQVPSTVERSRNLRPELRKPEKFLTPSNPKGKWKAKDPLSPDSLSPTSKPRNQKPSFGDKDRQWRPNAMNKENLENSEAVSPNLPSSKAKTSQNITRPTETNFGAYSKNESNTQKAVEIELPYEEVKVNLISPSPETPGSSPVSSKIAARTPGTPTDLSLSPSSPKSGSPKVIDEHQLEQRQKQIDYGHQTLGYLRYRLLVPKDKRSRDDPRTPKKTQACSKRSWDGQIKKWRRDLHQWDPEDPVAFMSWLESDFVVQMIRNNIGTELLELLEKIKERQAKFESSPVSSPNPSPLPLTNQADVLSTNQEDLDTVKIVRKLVFS